MICFFVQAWDLREFETMREKHFGPHNDQIRQIGGYVSTAAVQSAGLLTFAYLTLCARGAC